MYQRILVPLDKSKEAEGVLRLVQENLAPGGEVILLHIIRPGRAISYGEVAIRADEEEQAEGDRALSYLRGLISSIEEGSDKWSCKTIVSSSAAEGITRFAGIAEVDLIMTFTHDRKGLAKLIKRSIAAQVWRKSPIEVQVIKPRELASV